MGTNRDHTTGKLVTEGRALVLEEHEAVEIAVCTEDDCVSKNEAYANAARLAHCWNCHDELVEALEKVMKCLKGTSDLTKLGDSIYDIRYDVIDVLKKAKGE